MLPQGQLAPAADLARDANARSDFNIGFSGYRFNGDIGAYTVRFRHYDPTPGMCRWLERDPAGYQDGPSLYSYLGRNPMAGTDPYGLSFGGSGGAEEPGRRRVRTLLPKPGSGLRRSMVGADHPAAIRQRAEDDWRRRCGPQFGSDAEFAADMRFDPDRRERLREVAGGIRTGIETTASVLPGGGFATTVNEASQGNFGAAALGVIPGAAALKVLRVGSKTAKAAEAAAEASSKLNKSLASHAQLGEVGTTIAGAGARVPFRGAERIAEEYGGNAADWVKKSSSSYTAPDGTVFQTHWIENIRTGERIEFKTKFPRGS